jgi:hypothetical protein
LQLAGAAGEHIDDVGEADGFVDVMRDEQDRVRVVQDSR